VHSAILVSFFGHGCNLKIWCFLGWTPYLRCFRRMTCSKAITIHVSLKDAKSCQVIPKEQTPMSKLEHLGLSTAMSLTHLANVLITSNYARLVYKKKISVSLPSLLVSNSRKFKSLSPIRSNSTLTCTPLLRRTVLI
jgi:hypothetical protein